MIYSSVNKIIVLVLISVGLFNCNSRLKEFYYTGKERNNQLEGGRANLNQIQTRFGNNLGCNDPQNYIPDTNHLDHTPNKLIKVNFHWVNAEDSSRNYFGEKTIKFSQGLIKAANDHLGRNQKMWLPVGNKTPVIPPRFRFYLWPKHDSKNKGGIYEHYDDEVSKYVHKGKNQNIYDRRVMKKYAIDEDEVLNVFILPHDPDSVLSSTYTTYGVGVALGNFIKFSGPFEEKRSGWRYRGIFTHEVGHIFGLSHTWKYNDGCDDTPKHPGNCWGKTKEPPCDTETSNNLMDYNGYQNAITPCQIGRLLRSMSREQSSVRKFVAKTWCRLVDSKSITITDTIIWESEKDLQGNLTIAEGGQLTIKCRVSMPEKSKLIVQPGGSLVLDNCKLHNDCGKPWDGILLQEQGSKKANLETIGNFLIENATNGSNLNQNK